MTLVLVAQTSAFINTSFRFQSLACQFAATRAEGCNAGGLCFLTDSAFSLHSFLPPPSYLPYPIPSPSPAPSLLTPLPPLPPPSLLSLPCPLPPYSPSPAPSLLTLPPLPPPSLLFLPCPLPPYSPSPAPSLLTKTWKSSL